MDIKYISIKEALDIHERTIFYSGGGTTGQLDIGKLESVLEHIQNDLYYPTFEEKLTHLFYCVCQFHCFQDGNKRLAITLSAHFLIINGYMYVGGIFFKEMENISYHVANGNIKKELLYKIIVAFLNGTYNTDESLKLEIVNAMQNNLIDNSL